ncbi:MAG: hypothetical protein ABT940_05740 [Alphaproteobacteria bacterium]
MTKVETRVIPETLPACPVPTIDTTSAALLVNLPPYLRKPNLRRWEASQYLELVHGLTIAPSTLAKWATTGGGPAYFPAGRTPLYPRQELDRWATERLGKLVRSTSETEEAE